MTDRVSVSIADIGKTITGKTPSSQSPVDFGSKYMFVTPTDNFDNKLISKTERYLSEVGVEKLKSKALPPYSVMVTCIGSAMGKVSMNKSTCVTNQQINSILIDKRRYFPDYVYYTLRNNYKKLRNASSGSTALPLLNKTDFDSLRIDVHSDLALQESIAGILSSLDAKINLNSRINAELESMAKTFHDYWFVQFDFPDKNGKPYKSSGGKMVWNEELKQEIPEGWDAITIEQILAKESSTKKIQTSEIIQKGTIPVIDQSTDFIAGYTDDNESIIKVEEPRIIFGDHTRILKLINFDFARGADGTQVMLSNNRRMPQYLFYHTLLKIDLSNYGYARHYKFLKDQRIILPDEVVASKFNEMTSKYYELVKHNIFQNIELSELRDWLLPMLMNGQVKVN